MKRLFARLWLVACFFLLAPTALQAQSTESPIIVPSNASLLLINRSFPPPDDSRWTPVSLPDNWAQRGFRPEPQPVWYRFEFDVPTDFEKQGAWAVYLPYLYDGGEFFLNGKSVARIAESTSTTTVKWALRRYLRQWFECWKQCDSLAYERAEAQCVGENSADSFGARAGAATDL